MRTILNHPKRLCVALVTIVIAALGTGSASAAPASAHARVAASGTTVCGTVTGDRWKIPGSGEPSGDAYVVLAHNLGCKGARFAATVMVLGNPGFPGFKCRRLSHFNGDCKRTIRRGRRRLVQVFAWYADVAHPNGP
jgi:hypothetical protein